MKTSILLLSIIVFTIACTETDFSIHPSRRINSTFIGKWVSNSVKDSSSSCFYYNSYFFDSSHIYCSFSILDIAASSGQCNSGSIMMHIANWGVSNDSLFEYNVENCPVYFGSIRSLDENRIAITIHGYNNSIDTCTRSSDSAGF